jgi:sterol desaturase/sphingolipid hydroxylase (fatty acid hydroxylase superfamily)
VPALSEVLVKALHGARIYADILSSVILLSLIFFLLERWVPAQKDQPRTRLLFNLLYYPLVLAWILVLQLPFGQVHDYLLSLADGGLLPALVGEPGGVAARTVMTLLFVASWDVWQYWGHRWQHSSAFLWETHRLHHDETALNFSGQARHHALHYLYFNILYLPLLFVFGSFSPPAALVFVMFRVWGFVNHANIRVDFRRLTVVVAGPQWHRIHHSIVPAHRDRNFATFFPVIDKVFGTYYRPARDEYPETGINGNVVGSVRAATVAPLLEWKRRWAPQDSNLGPTGYEPAALTAELGAREKARSVKPEV